ELQLALADWMLANGLPQAAQQYQDLSEPYRSEGLGLIAAKAGNREVAIKELSSAVAAQSESARVYYELGQLEKDTPKKQADWKHAVDLNPHWGAPFAALAKLEPNPISQSGWLPKPRTPSREMPGIGNSLPKRKRLQTSFPKRAAPGHEPSERPRIQRNASVWNKHGSMWKNSRRIMPNPSVDAKRRSGSGIWKPCRTPRWPKSTQPSSARTTSLISLERVPYRILYPGTSSMETPKLADCSIAWSAAVPSHGW